jgi:uncharacterized protein YycO
MIQANRNNISSFMKNQIGDPYSINTSKYSNTTWYCSKLQFLAYYLVGVDIDSNGVALCIH